MRSERYYLDSNILYFIADRIPIISSDEKFHDYKRSKLNFIFNER